MTTNMDKINAIRAKAAELKKELMEANKEVFSESAKELFEKFPKLDWFEWTQYTPYFNDGDECTFSVNAEDNQVWINGLECENGGFYFSTTKWSKDSSGKSSYIDKTDEEILSEEFNSDEGTTFRDLDMTVSEIVKLKHAIPAFVQSFDEDYLKEAFGDHTSVKMHRDGTVENDEYEHD